MRIAKFILFAALATITSASKADAQPAAVAGKWTLRYEHQPSGMHNADAAIQERRALLTLQLNGDSVFGEWQAIVPAPDSAPPPRALRGIRRGDSILVRLDADVDPNASMIATMGHEIVEFIKTYVHGMPPTTTALDVSIRGDSIMGTRRTVLMDGTARGKAFVLSGVRAKP